MAFPHGDFPVDQYVIGIMYDPAHDGIWDGTVCFQIRIDPCVPACRFILGTEDHRSLLTPGFHDLQRIVGFLASERTDQSLVKDQQVCFLIRLDGFLQSTASFCHIQLIQKF